MSEIRRDPTTGEWVILAAGRAERPGGTRLPGRRSAKAGRDPDCPFCLGNEDQTPPEILRRSARGDWVVRIVPNKYPALVAEVSHHVLPNSDFETLVEAHGHYEVIIEGSTHRLGLVPPESGVLFECFLAARDRYRVFVNNSALKASLLFKNHGRGAGASLAHPHWQLAALPTEPATLTRMMGVARAHWERSGTSLYDDLVRHEVAGGDRVVEEVDEFVVMTPYAPQWAGETWIIPRDGVSGFADVGETMLQRFSSVLRRTFGRLSAVFDEPDLNVLLLSAPFRPANVPYFQWHARLQPRLTTPGGFELASGMMITTVGPEQSAASLRAVESASG